MKFFILLLLTTAIGATFFADMGEMTVLWHGFELRTNIIAGAAILWALASLALMILHGFWLILTRRMRIKKEEAED